MSTTPQNPDVVIVGAGPVGLVAACELARRGVTFRIIDKLEAPTDESRAIAVHARSSTCSTGWAYLDDLLATGVKSTGMNMFAGRNKMFQVPLDSVDSPFPYTLVTAQTETERVLTERLRALGVTVDRGLTLTGLTQDDDVVHLTLRRVDGTTEQCRHAWVIGTDGGHSTCATWSGPSCRARSRVSVSSSATSKSSRISTTRTCTRTSPPTAQSSRCRCAAGGFGSWHRSTTHRVCR